jgi:hypothetical protein
VQLEVASRSGEWRRVDVPEGVAAIMVENLPKRWAKGDDFWDGRESGVRAAALRCAAALTLARGFHALLDVRMTSSRALQILDPAAARQGTRVRFAQSCPNRHHGWK